MWSSDVGSIFQKTSLSYIDTSTAKWSFRISWISIMLYEKYISELNLHCTIYEFIQSITWSSGRLLMMEMCHLFTSWYCADAVSASTSRCDGLFSWSYDGYLLHVIFVLFHVGFRLGEYRFLKLSQSVCQCVSIALTVKCWDSLRDVVTLDMIWVLGHLKLRLTDGSVLVSQLIRRFSVFWTCCPLEYCRVIDRFRQ